MVRMLITLTDHKKNIEYTPKKTRKITQHNILTPKRYTKLQRSATQRC
jgi:hypothetical protein